MRISPSCTGFMDTADVTVVGAGIIGVACALQLIRRGLSVTLVDRDPPGMGASYGNAGHLATEQVFPIADLGILKRLPAMLLDPMGPLRLDWKYLPQAMPWFVRLLLNLRREPYRRSVAGIRALNDSSLDAWQRLLGSIDRREILKQDGSLLVFENPESRAAIIALQARMREQGVPVELWQAEAIRAAAPQLSEHLLGGLFFPGTGHFLNPHEAVDTLYQAAMASGVQFLRRDVRGGSLSANGVSLQTEKDVLKSSQVVIACGAHSAHLTKLLTGVSVPLDTERGYHLMLPHEQDRLPFAVTSLERKFIMTPMREGLRLAGTVEFAGLKRPANMARAWQLQRLSQGLFKHELNVKEATPWMGFRPSLPDSLPVIDSVADGRVLLAFGHQHLGLTQAAVTAEMVAVLAGADAPAQALPACAPYRLARF